MKKLPETEFALVIRTDFSNDALAEAIFEEAIKGDLVNGFKPYLHFLQNPTLDGFNPHRIKEILPEVFFHSFIFTLDHLTITHPDHPFLCLDLREDTFGRAFRVIPKEMWSVENNLTLANMDFEEFTDYVEEDGIYRGFQE